MAWFRSEHGPSRRFGISKTGFSFTLACSPYQVTIRSSNVPSSGDVFAALVSEEYVGLDVTAKFVSIGDDRQKRIWKEKCVECREGEGIPEREELNLMSTPACQEELVPQSSALCLKEQSSTTGPLKESWAVGSFSGPTFSLLPVSSQSPGKRDDLEVKISEQDDSQPERGDETGVKRGQVTKLNVFDHIRKKSRRLPGLSSLSQTNTLACVDPTEKSAATETNQMEGLTLKTYLAKVLNDERGRALQSFTPEEMANDLDRFFCKEEPRSRSKVACFDTRINQPPDSKIGQVGADRSVKEFASSTSVLTPQTLNCNEAPLKDLSVCTSTSSRHKQSSPSLVSAGFSCGRGESESSFMGCTSIFSFL